MSDPAAPIPVDLLVLGGIVVTMDAGRTVLPDGAIAVRDGAIVAVGPRDAVAAYACGGRRSSTRGATS
jgi:5-methylthioadenosine/S-adenosylhomocysteine deaminase